MTTSLPLDHQNQAVSKCDHLTLYYMCGENVQTAPFWNTKIWLKHLIKVFLIPSLPYSMGIFCGWVDLCVI